MSEVSKPHSVLDEIEAMRPVCSDPKQVDIALAEARDLIEQLEALKRLETFARNEAETGKSAHIRNWCSFALAAAGLNDSNPASVPNQDTKPS